MTTIETSAPASAWIVSSLTGHSRQYDHYGTQVDTVVVIDGPIGPWPSGTDLHTVLSGIEARITALEIGNHRVASFSAGAFIHPWIGASAVIAKTVSRTFHTIDAKLTYGLTAQITADALLILHHSVDISAGAWLIDDVVC